MSVDKSLFISGVTERYDERLLEKRVETEGNIVGAIYSDLLLLDDFKLNKDMFFSKDARFYFGLANDLKKKNFNVIDEVTIRSNSTDDVISAFEERGGIDVIDNIVSVINSNNFDAYLDNLYRENMLCKMYLDGFDLFKEKEINGKKIVPLNLFRKMSCGQVIDYFEAQLSGYEVGQSSMILEEEDIDFNDEWLKGLESGENVGIPFENAGCDINGKTINCFQFLSRQTLGIHNGTLSVLAAFPSTGKSTWIITLLMALLYQQKKVLIISNEEEISKFRSKFLVWTLARYNRYYKLSKSKLESGNISDDDKKQIKIARKYWNDNYKGRCHFVSMNCTDMKIVAKKIREYTLRYGVDVFVFDTFKLADDSFSGERTDLALVRDSRELFNLARKYDIAVLATAQLAERFRGNLFLSAAHLSGAKAIKEICELLFEMRRVFQEELDVNSKYYIKPFQRKKINGKWIEEEYRLDQTASYAVLFPEKNRRGDDSSNGEAYLLKFIGSQAVFKEVAFCRPKHGTIQ